MKRALADLESPLSEAEQALQRIGETAVNGLVDGLAKAITMGGDLGDTFRNLAGQLATMFARQALMQTITSALGKDTWLAGMFAQGGAFDAGNVVPFAHGGIVSAPTIFPMTRGLGLMGEEGPEAIMPLMRMQDGRLGVSAMSGNHGGRPIVINQHTNVDL